MKKLPSKKSLQKMLGSAAKPQTPQLPPLKQTTPTKVKRNANLHVTKSGKTIKIHSTITDRFKAKREMRARKRAERMALMPKSRVKRFFWRLHPKRVVKYWFSREGVLMGLKLTGIGIALLFVLVLGIFSYFRKDLPNIKDLSASTKGGSVRYFDRTGNTLLWEDFDSFKRIPVKDDEIAQFMKDATVAIEDRDFYNHGGFNAKGILRAALNNAEGGATQGGSTITQQLVKQTQDWTNQRTVALKIKELILAVELERSYSKSEILTAYLNIVPYGSFENGVEAATQAYFQKNAKDLTLDEAAMLATIPKSPNRYSYYNPAFVRADFVSRYNYILDVMADQGKITAQQRDEAKATDVLAKIKPRKESKYTDIIAPYFVFTAKEELERVYEGGKLDSNGWKVITTLDLELQKVAEEEVKKGIVRVRSNGGDTTAFAAEDVRTGQMVAMVGGPDFSDRERAGEINFATQFLPPGSSFKPYDYASLIEATGAGAGSVLFDTRAPLDGYPCTNFAPPRSGGNCLHDYDLRFPGPVTIRYALAGSRNVPAVKAMLYSGATPREGIDKTIAIAKNLGLESGYHCYDPAEFDKGIKVEAPCYASSAIGDGAYLRLDEHVHGYASLSRDGKNIPQTYILKILDFKGKTVAEWTPKEGTQAIKAETAYIISDILSDPNASYFSFGFGKRNRVPGASGSQHKISFKTGTTNDNKDGWMMSYSTYYAAGVWVGHHTGRVAFPRSVTMESMTDPILTGFMKRAHANLPPIEREKPAGLQTLPAYVIRSSFSSAGGEVIPSTATDLFPSWYPGQKKQTGASKPIDIVSGKTATDCTPALAKKEVTTGSAESFSADPTSQKASEQLDDVHKCDDVKPSVTVSVSKLSPGQYVLAASVAQGTHPLSSDKYKGKVTFSIDGQAIPNGEVQIDASGVVTLNYASDRNGDATIGAEVVDSVLYNSTDQTTVSFDQSVNDTMTLNAPSTVKASEKNTFTWTDVASVGQSYQFCITRQGGSEVCTNVGNDNEYKTPVGTFLTGNYTAVVKLLNGSTIVRSSDGVSFTVVP